jgi:aerobic carbon-monoxide dehydrogenase large subunit
LFVGTHSHGQSHATVFAQLSAARLGLGIDAVEVVFGDTGRDPFGLGTYGSRSISIGGPAIARAADKIVAKGRRIAAHLLEAAVEDVVFEAGRFQVAGTDRAVTLGEVALAAYVPHNFPHAELEPGLDEQATYFAAAATFPNGCHVAEVEVDPETGQVRLVAYTTVDDVGTAINPLVVAGQVHGGVAQGVGEALLERVVHDPSSGQLLSGSFLDYAMPRADDLVAFACQQSPVPCRTNPLGVKGAGELGSVAAPAAVMNAVLDALAPAGVTALDLPATPERVWRALAGQRGG